jgi:hypothetical protein
MCNENDVEGEGITFHDVETNACESGAGRMGTTRTHVT